MCWEICGILRLPNSFEFSKLGTEMRATDWMEFSALAFMLAHYFLWEENHFTHVKGVPYTASQWLVTCFIHKLLSSTLY
jgi:hypothetical protein